MNCQELFSRRYCSGAQAPLFFGTGFWQGTTLVVPHE
jgi:hypothetical protein